MQPYGASMKSYILGALLICSVILNIFQLMENETIVYNDLDSDYDIVLKNDKVKTGQASIRKNEQLLNDNSHLQNLGTFKKSVLGAKDAPESGPMMKTQINENFNESEIEKAQEVWREKATDFFVEEFDFENGQIDEYFNLGKARELEISEYLEQQIDGDNTFIYTVENMVEENKINIKYLDKMKALFGEVGYEKYKTYRNKYNREMMDREEGYFPIEL
jgi:hypothetical protein